MLTAAERGYIAGLIDGEGCIRIKKGGSHPSAKSYTYLTCLEVANTYRPVLDWLCDLFGGRVTADRRKEPTHQQCYHWAITGRSALGVLAEVRDLMRIKSAHVWLALEAVAQCEPYAGVHHLGFSKGTAPRSDEESALREGYYLAMRTLNPAGARRGLRKNEV